MEQEMLAKSGGTMNMDPPPSYPEPKNKTKPFLIAIVTMTLATLLVVSFGVFYLVFNGQSPAVINNVTTDGEPVVTVRDVSFEMSDGVSRHEQMIAEGNKLTIENSHDGYTVVFDFDRDLAVFKNRTTSSCYFTRLDALPVEMKMDNLTANLPVFFTEVPTENNGLLKDSNTIVFSNLQPIPTGYLKLTTTEICADGLSFWMGPMEAERVRYTRKIRFRLRCRDVCVVAVVALLVFGG